ncbi:hypothetical protein LNP74_21900 [Klebsiella pneumoniae subsp. pneumoniae]|nr:hypothetical protein [Klebsiella pneumoniae subsp. pneumoniae]
MKDADKQEYTGARNARGSLSSPAPVYSRSRRSGRWWRSWSRPAQPVRAWSAARIEPEWVEPVAQHLIKRSYSEPHWEQAQGAVMATERSPFTALRTIVAARKSTSLARSTRRCRRTVYPPCAGGGRLADASRLLPR